MLRRIIEIDREKCNGCGACAEACLEGAIAEINRRTFTEAQQFDVIRRDELIDQTKRM